MQILTSTEISEKLSGSNRDTGNLKVFDAH